MCRYDDGDYAWRLAHYEDATVGLGRNSVRCEDCGRVLDPGEHYTVAVGDPSDGDYDDRPMVTVVRKGAEIVAIIDEPLWAPGDEDGYRAAIAAHDQKVDAYEADGCDVEEERDPRVEVEMVRSPWCDQCRAANEWLVDVCDQSMLLVAHEDIAEHLCDYNGWLQLGPAFMRLAWFNAHGWRDRTGALVPVERIKSLTAKAIAYAHGPRGVVGAH